MNAVPPPIPDDDNPYRAPFANVEAPGPAMALASRGQRLGAAILDSLVVVPVAIVVAILMPAAQKNPNLMIAVVVLIVAAAIAIITVNLVGIYRTGQTIGKRLLGIRVVRSDGERVDFARYLFMRWFAIALIGNIPLIGPFISLLNVLLIFRDSRRCLHDDFADTIVILA